MRVVSVHVGVPREVVWNGKLVKTGPFTPRLTAGLRCVS